MRTSSLLSNQLALASATRACAGRIPMLHNAKIPNAALRTFPHSLDTSDYTIGDFQSSMDVYLFLQAFMARFPQVRRGG